MRQKYLLGLFWINAIINCIGLQSCSDGCMEGDTDKGVPSAYFTIVFKENDTLNLIEKVHYPQINKTVSYSNWAAKEIKYLYGFDENIIVLNYKYPSLRSSDTLVVDASIIKGIEEAPCSNEYLVKYAKVAVKKHPFNEIVTNETTLTVIKR